jgi:hypothetical protein
MPDQDPHPHRHHPLLRITVSACPADQEALLLDVDLGAPLPDVTGDQVATVLEVLAASLAARLDLAWAAVADQLASRN